MVSNQISIDQLLADPSRAGELEGPQRRAVIQRCAAAIAIVSSAEITAAAPPPSTRVLNVKEAAQLLGKSTTWMKRDGRALPGAMKTGRTWGWLEESLIQYARKRAGR